jgi:V/A-type H+/Na+-transporting ATPase subunit D
MRLRIPPGRAGRLWLRERLAAAKKAADLMDHKRRELEAELRRVRTILGERERAWRAAAREAEQWLCRADAAGAERSLRLGGALVDARAEVELDWRQVMGVRYAADYATRLPTEPPVSSLDGGTALAPAVASYRRAVEAAIAHAIARTALDRIRTDIERTKRRLRALELRAIPAHESALRELELTLDERSRQEAVAARWAAEGAPLVSTGEPER